MEIRYPPDPAGVQRMTTEELRSSFLVDGLFVPGMSEMVYWGFDRPIIGSAVPADRPLVLETSKELAAEYFAQMREVGVLNIGAEGFIDVDDTHYPMAHRDVLYIGKGSRKIEFGSADSGKPAQFYIVSYPAHASYPTTRVTREEASAVTLGSPEMANVRTIRKYILPGTVRSCQLVMGVTDLAEGSVWNTMPAHTHARRSEVYIYFNMKDDAVVFHLMGEPLQTRHLAVRNRQVVLSPSWSIHSGVGTTSYSFVWAMGGENQDFDDMDGVGPHEII
jgi:4-deoxy-L-threo-5-hexosulose-uronate ketol-isomerase